MTSTHPAMHAAEWRSSPGGPIPKRKTAVDPAHVEPRHFLARWSRWAVAYRRAGADIFSGADGVFNILDQANIEANAHISRELINARTVPEDTRLSDLSGVRAGGQLRSTLRTLFPEPVERDTAQYLLLYDLAGATLVSSWAGSRGKDITPS